MSKEAIATRETPPELMFKGLLDGKPTFLLLHDCEVYSVQELDKGAVRWESVLISVHSVVETLHLEKDQTTHGPMLTTNVFTRGTNGWRLLSRHTSAAAEEPENGDEDAYGGHQHTLH